MADIIPLQAKAGGSNIIVTGAIGGPIGATGPQGATGAAGVNGTNGTNGVGVPVGGASGYVLTKASATNYDTIWTAISAPVTAIGSVTRDVTQNAHGLSVGDIIRFGGSSTGFVKSQANTNYNAEVLGIVVGVANVNQVTICTEGHVTGLSSLAAGGLYFLSPTVAGAMTITEPSTVGQVSKPLFTATSTTSGYFHNYRGIVIA